MSEGKDSQHHQHDEGQPPPPHYGTFQGVANYPPPQPTIGFPHPVPPPGATGQPSPVLCSWLPGVPVVEGRPVTVREHRLPCCGIGCSWFLFIIGFFLAGIPWYVGAFVLLCARFDHREKPGYVACTIAAVLGTIALIFGLTKNDWD